MIFDSRRFANIDLFQHRKDNAREARLSATRIEALQLAQAGKLEMDETDRLYGILYPAAVDLHRMGLIDGNCKLTEHGRAALLLITPRRAP